MSNPISLFAGDIDDIVRRLGTFDEDIDADNDYEFPYPNALPDGMDSDYCLQDLGELVVKNRGIRWGPWSKFLESFTWDWTRGKMVNDLGVDPDRYGVNAVIANASLWEMNLEKFDPRELANKLYAENEYWDTPEDLGEYLEVWHRTYLDAMKNGQGIVLAVWV